MAKAPAKIPAPASVWKTEASHVSVIARRAAFWCAGVKFGAAAKLVAKADLDDDQAARLVASPFLVVTEIAPPSAGVA